MHLFDDYYYSLECDQKSHMMRNFLPKFDEILEIAFPMK